MLDYLAPLTLTCRTCGGVPPPTLQWTTQLGQVISSTTRQDQLTGCTQLALSFDRVGEEMSDGEMRRCRVLETLDSTSVYVGIKDPCLARHSVTDEEFHCVFPFSLNGVGSYEKCVKNEGDVFWCPTSSNYVTGSSEFGFCSEMCPWEQATECERII